MPESFKSQDNNCFDRPPETIEFLGRTLKLINWGRHRNTYDNGKFVVKVPRGGYGLHDNEKEARIFKHTRTTPDDNVRYARCRLLPNGYLVMEKLKTDLNYDQLPKWSYRIDCGQVGVDAKGAFKAYDYAE